MMVLLRHLLGDVLRRLRQRQGRTLREVSADARVSLGYLSEVERGQKEASSELLSSICGALNVPLSQVLREVSDLLALAELQEAALLDDAVTSQTVSAKELGIDPVPDRVPQVADMVGVWPPFALHSSTPTPRRSRPAR